MSVNEHYKLQSSFVKIKYINASSTLSAVCHSLTETQSHRPHNLSRLQAIEAKVPILPNTEMQNYGNINVILLIKHE